MLIIIFAVVILGLCIIYALLLANKVPQKVDVQLEVPLLSNSDCSLEKVVVNLQIANKLGDIESAVQQRVL